MKSVRFLRDIPDKYTGEQYVKGQVKEFEDERADEILNARQENGKPYAEEVLAVNEVSDSTKTEENTEKTQEEVLEVNEVTEKSEKSKKKAK